MSYFSVFRKQELLNIGPLGMRSWSLEAKHKPSEQNSGFCKASQSNDMFFFYLSRAWEDNIAFRVVKSFMLPVVSLLKFFYLLPSKL